MSVAEPIPVSGFHTRRQPAPGGDPYADAPTDILFEVVNGIRVEKSMSLVERLIAGWLFGRLDQFCRENAAGHATVEVMFAIPSSGHDRRPDVAFVSYQTWPRGRAIPRVNAWRVVPDLAVEVVSPSDDMFDVFEKLTEYFAGGVKEVWLVLSNVEQVHRYTSPTAVRILTRADDLTGDPLIPGFRLPLAELFPVAESSPDTP